MKSLPIEEKECEKLPRQYIANVIYTVIGDPFQKWVNEQVQARHAKMTKEHRTEVDMDPEIEAIFQASNHISSK